MSIDLDQFYLDYEPQPLYRYQYKSIKVKYDDVYTYKDDTVNSYELDHRFFEEVLPYKAVDFYNTITELQIYSIDYKGDEFKTPLPENLKIFKLVQCNVANISKLSPKLEALICWGNKLKELPELPETLKLIWCSSNKLIKLPKLPNKLIILSCHDNNITELIDLPDSLITIDCNYNDIQSINKLPQNLIKLASSYNKLEKLPNLPNGLKTMEVLYNEFNCLPELPDSLTYLDCSENKNLTELPKLPNRLDKLYCHDCSLNNIPNMPILLKDLDCYKNNLTKLPKCSKMLEKLNCSDNKLTELPKLYENINSLVCFNNQITKLQPDMPIKNLKWINIHDNKIEDLPYTFRNVITCDNKSFRRQNYSFDGSFVNYNEKIFAGNPFNEKIKRFSKPWDTYRLFTELHDYLDIVAANAIGEWFLRCKYDPRYKYCRDRLKNEHETLFTNGD